MNTTTYSTWNYGSKRYDYYQAPGDGATHAGPSTIRSSGNRDADRIGATPELAAWRLPAGAVKVGSGDLPRGRIASMGSFDVGSDGPKVGLMLLAAYLAWKVLR